MSDITMTRQTNLRGTALQNAVGAMVTAMSRRSPFNTTQIVQRWESGSRLTFVATGFGQTQATGAINITEGSPSTVVASVDLLTATSRNARGDVESAMVEESDRALQPIGAAAQTSTQTPAQTSSQTQRPAVSSADRWAQWGLASNILGDIFGGAAAGLDAYNQQMGYATAQEAVQVAAQEAQNAGIPIPHKTAQQLAPPPPASVVRPQQSGPTVVTPTPFPTWGWVILGLGGAGLITFVVWTAVTKHG